MVILYSPMATDTDRANDCQSLQDYMQVIRYPLLQYASIQVLIPHEQFVKSKPKSEPISYMHKSSNPGESSSAATSATVYFSGLTFRSSKARLRD